MLPDPTLTLTIPSIHDGTVLDCRVYHPYSLSPSLRAPPWQKHAAVIAHPYAPLGGCYDDPVVDVVAAALLRLGFLVATFNFRCESPFPLPGNSRTCSVRARRVEETRPKANWGKHIRGASGSAGRTSWTARAERADYMSVVGFISYYAYHLDPFQQQQDGPPIADATHRDDTSTSSPLPKPDVLMPAAPLLLLAGYSYGAMITAQLPCLETINTTFLTPASGSSAADIRHRAEHLADAQNTVLGEARSAAAAAAISTRQKSTKSPRKSLGLRVGGHEDSRRSHDSERRSFSSEAEERFRKGLADVVALAKRGHHHNHYKSRRGGHRGAADDRDGRSADGGGEKLPTVAHGDDRLPAPANPPLYRVAYLLISPLQGLVTNLATMSFPNPFSKHNRQASPGQAISSDDSSATVEVNNQTSTPIREESEQKLVRNPTLAVYGDRDVFVAARKLREWAHRLEGLPDSQFRAHEISTATHFWTEDRVVYLMREAVKTFAEGLLEHSSQLETPMA